MSPRVVEDRHWPTSPDKTWETKLLTRIQFLKWWYGLKRWQFLWFDDDDDDDDHGDKTHGATKGFTPIPTNKSRPPTTHQCQVGGLALRKLNETYVIWHAQPENPPSHYIVRRLQYTARTCTRHPHSLEWKHISSTVGWGSEVCCRGMFHIYTRIYIIIYT